MIDVHTHFLPGADDCVATVEESIAILKQAETIGITTVALTACYLPHLGYTKTIADNCAVLDILAAQCATQHINVTLLLGNEVLLDKVLIEKTEDGLFGPIGESRTMLIETPEDIDMLKQLKDKGYQPLLANPERYAFVDRAYVIACKALGAKLQGSLLSLDGHYGKTACDKLSQLLGEGQIDCLATGARDGSAYAAFARLKEKAVTIVGSVNFDYLTNDAPAKLLGL